MILIITTISTYNSVALSWLCFNWNKFLGLYVFRKYGGKGSLTSIIRMIKSMRMRWAGHVARMGAKGSAYRILVGKPEGKMLLGKPRHRCVDNIKMDLREIGWGGMNWIDLTQDRDQWRVL
jgi:hypothetical protein